MKKAVISDRIYMNASSTLERKIDEELTYKIAGYDSTVPPTIIKNMGRFKEGIITIPRGRIDLIPRGYDIVDKRISVPAVFPTPKFDLRKNQEKVYNNVKSDCVINAWVSWGKTFTALHIAKKLRQKTLVVVHTVQLRNQWAREIKKIFGIEPGIIGSGKFETDKCIVVANVQTLRKHIVKVKKMFGTIILDEMHHVSSKTFSEIIDHSHAKYRIGLSGTITRKDGKHVVFRDYFGPVIHKPAKENYMVPTVDIVETNIELMDGQLIPWATKVNKLISNPAYFELVSTLAATYSSLGHKVLVVGDRVEFLKACADAVGDTAVYARIDIEEVLFGTQSIFSEGISINVLSCLILAAPINNDPLLTQLIGRVVRESPGKLQPKIVDIHLRGNTARRQANVRTGHYLKNGYKMRKI